MSKTDWKTLLMICAALLASSVSGAVAGYGPRTYADIHPSGWISSKAVCVNDSGEVAGYGVTAGGERGFLWINGRYTTILPPGAVSCTVSWMNGSGEVAGTSFDAAGIPRAFVYRDGEYVDPTPGWEYSEALYIAEDGSVTGRGEKGAFVASAGGISIEPAFRAVVGKNSEGFLLGYGEGKALLYVPGKGCLCLLPPGAESASPGRMNEKGVVTFSSSAQGVERGFVYSGGFMVFMTPPGWSSSRAAAINARSEVVGYGNSPQGERGFLRSGPDSEEIAVPGWTATRPESLNALGQAAGSGETGYGETHAFLSSPASLSATVVIATGSGGGVLAGGGCTMAPVRGELAPAAGAGNLLVLLGPAALLLARSLRKSGFTRR